MKNSPEKLPDDVEVLRHEADEEAHLMNAELEIEQAPEKRSRGVLTIAMRYLLPLAMTVALVWYMCSSVPFPEVIKSLRGANYWWILLAMGISIFSHIFRAARWRLQLRALGINVPFLALCCSIFGCYSLNLVFPRLGEVWRCTYVAKKGRAPFTTVLGSMVSDRITDTLSVICLIILTFIVANSHIREAMEDHEIGHNLLTLAANPWIWVAAALCLALIVCVFYFGRSTVVIKKLLQWLHELWMGAASLWQMKGRWLFALLTVGIWGSYFIQLYVAFFAFDFTGDLCKRPDLAFGLIPCLVAFVLSSIGMAIPTNGGLGAWNLGIIWGLEVFKISELQGTSFSWAQWGGQTVMLVILGIFTMIYIAFSKEPKNIHYDRG